MLILPTWLLVAIIVLGSLSLAWAGTCSLCHKRAKKDTELITRLIIDTTTKKIKWKNELNHYRGRDPQFRDDLLVSKGCSMLYIGSKHGTPMDKPVGRYQAIGRPVALIRALKRCIRRSSE